VGKNARMREQRKTDRAEERLLELENAPETQKKKRLKKVILIAAAVIAVVGIAVGIICGTLQKQGYFLRNGVAMKTENFEVTGQMMAYYVYTTFEGYYNQYGDALGLDPSVSLKKQQLNKDASWFDYFVLETKTKLREVLLFAEKATEQGLTLSDEDKEQITAYVDTANISTYEDLFAFSRDDLRKAMELTTLASKMYEKAVEKMDLSDEAVEKHFNENKKYFQYVDLDVISIPYGANGWFKEIKDAKSAADIIAKATTKKQFENLAKSLMTTIGATEQQALDQIESGKQKQVYFVDNNAVYTWAFDTSRKELETYVHDTGSSYDVYQLITLPVVDETVKLNVRHILLSKETCDTDLKAKEKAEELLAEWKKGEMTPAAFGELAKKYSEDPGSASAGGLYENVGQGEMVTAFNDWCFDKDRKVGDTEVIKSPYGYHVMYLEGNGQKQWQISAKNSLTTKNTSDLCTEYQKTWNIQEKDGFIKRMPL
jgi:parvulin-like peptidyl-prolyl isomerase